MATLFFSRGGKDPIRAERQGELSMESVMEFFRDYDCKYSSKAPLIDSDNEPSPYSTCTNVVVEIDKGETNEKFAQAGYYWFPKIRPADCEKLIRLP